MSLPKLNWIDTLFFGVRRLYDNGSELPERPALNIINAIIEDDPINNWISITISDPIVGSATSLAIPDTLALRDPGAGCNFTTLGCTVLNASIEINTVDLNVSGILSVNNLTASGTIIGNDIQAGTLEVSGNTTISDLFCNNINANGDLTVNGLSYLTDIVTCSSQLVTSSFQINTSQVIFEKSNTTPGLFHTAQTTNTTPISTIITTQAPFVSATLTNRKPGDCIINLPAPTNGASGFASEGRLSIQKAGVTKLLIGQDTNNYKIEAQTSTVFQTVDVAATTGNLTIKTGNGTFAGDINIKTGNGTMAAGKIIISTGSSLIFDGPSINITTGGTSFVGQTARSGHVFISTANQGLVDGSAAGNIYLSPGACSGSFLGGGSNVHINSLYAAGALGNNFSANYGKKCIILGDVSAGGLAPSGVTSEGILFVQNGILKYKGTSGTITTIAVA